MSNGQMIRSSCFSPLNLLKSSAWRSVVVSGPLTDKKPLPGKSSNERLRRAQRVRDSRDFQKVYASRQKIHAAGIIVCYLANGLPFSRLGLSVGSKHGNAVVRNRIKRVFRAAFRAGLKHLPIGFDYVLIPKDGAGEHSTATVLSALTDAGKKIEARTGAGQQERK
jgi:ribonuclease P protein component